MARAPQRIAALACALALTTAVVAPPRAHACGGFFCSQSPVDQSGETIVYALEGDGTMTMSVQIQYQGDDDDFAWILPVPAPPTIALGSDALFDEIRRATDPIFVTDRRTSGTCRPTPRCVTASGRTAYTGGCGFSGASSSPWMGGYVDAGGLSLPTGGADAGTRNDTGVTVFSEAPVGPYDTVVLGAATAAEVLQWLQDHDYQVPSGAGPLLEPYAAAGQVFVALRLRTSRDTRVLRPIVLNMASEELCLPIRLTAIATVPEMPITAFFLGQHRVVPRNFNSADPEVNLDFWTRSRTWETAVIQEVDRLGGHAFATDYAGPTPALQLELPSVSDLATETDAHRYLETLQRRGYQGTTLLFDLLQQHLQPPVTRSGARSYYNCLFRRSEASCGTPRRFDAAALTAAIETFITGPRREAHALVHRHNYLTRLFTTMSAEDMTIDPLFREEPGIENVSNVHRATLVTECGESTYYRQDAPQRWEHGTEERAGRAAGDEANDEQYCRSRNLYLPGTEPGTSSGGSTRGCIAALAGGAPLPSSVLLAALMILWMRRRRR